MRSGILEQQNDAAGIKADSAGSASAASGVQLWVSSVHRQGRTAQSALGRGGSYTAGTVCASRHSQPRAPSVERAVLRPSCPPRRR